MKTFSIACGHEKLYNLFRSCTDFFCCEDSGDERTKAKRRSNYARRIEKYSKKRSGESNLAPNRQKQKVKVTKMVP